MPSPSLFTPDSQLVRQIISPEMCHIMREATPKLEHLRLYSNRHSQSLRVLSSFEQALKAALTGRSYGLLAGHEFVAVVTDLTWALLQKVADDGTRLTHLLEVTQFPVPPGWRIPITLHTLSRVDIRFRQAILAIIARLLLPQHFATMASTSSYLSRPDACSRLLRILGPEQADALLAHSRRWPSYFRMRMMRAKGNRPLTAGLRVDSLSTD